jgi:hypothetical protein
MSIIINGIDTQKAYYEQITCQRDDICLNYPTECISCKFSNKNATSTLDLFNPKKIPKIK